MTWKCPKCGSKDLRVFITATARLVQYDDNFETEIDSDHEWDEHADMVCNSCDFTGESHDFEEPTQPGALT